MYKIKLFLGTAWRFCKLNPAYTIVSAVILGTVVASVAAVITVNSLKSGSMPVSDSSDSSSYLPVSISEPEQEAETEETIAPAEPQPVEKQVEYKGKTINVVKVEVAKTDSKEDIENGTYIAEKPQEKAPAEPVTTAKTIKYKSPAGEFKGGIDVSSHNKEIDWEKVKNAGVQFAMIRCGYRGYLTGKIVLDANFDYNIENACKNGIDVGIYFYSTATNETEALEEAAYVAEVIKAKEEQGIEITYPVAYDFEEFYNTDSRTRAKGLSALQISENTDAFLSYIKSQGYKPMLYAGKNPVKQHWEQWVVSKYDFWLAHYTEATEYTGNFLIWQYTSSGEVEGISGRVDLNISGFKDNNNLPRFTVCSENGVQTYKKPVTEAEKAITLSKNTVYICRNTYDPDYLELKIDGVYYYVKAKCLSEIPFEDTEDLYIEQSGHIFYSNPYDAPEYKVQLDLPDGERIKISRIWENIWARAEYDGKTYYLKADSIKTGDGDTEETQDETVEE